MGPPQRSFAWFALLLALTGCDSFLSTFTVPPQVWAGQVFEVVLRGSTGGASTGSPASGILQLPNGFAVEGALAYVGQSSSYLTGVITNGGSRDDPAVLALMTPEPGHYLASFSAFAPVSMQSYAVVALKVYIRAPQAIGASFTLKAVGVPTGTTSFAAITTAPNAQPCTVVGSPQSPFVMDTMGLLAPGTQTSGVGVAFGDIDADGNDDLAHVAVNGSAPGPSVWLSRPGAAWLQRSPGPTAAGSYNSKAAFGDFDGDGHLDLADTSGRILFGDGGTTWTPGPTLPLIIPEWAGVGVGDVDGDGQDDVAFSAFTTDAVQVFRSAGNRTFVEWSNNLPTGTNGPAGAQRLALRDVTRDGFCDLVTSGWIGSRVWAGDGQGGWTPANLGLPNFRGFAFGDLDGDGQHELVASATTGVIALTYIAGAWTQLPLVLPTGQPSNAEALALLDYDRDGRLDLVVAVNPMYFAPPPPSVVLFRNLTGFTFAAPVALSTVAALGNGCTDLAVGDIDGDSWPDLAAAISGEHPIVWRNTGSGLSPYGSACGAVGFPTPRTTAIGQPHLGNSTFAFELQNATPNSFGMLWIGLSKRYASGQPILPFDLASYGAPGCAVVASTEAQRFVFTDALGHAQLPMPIPNDPVLQRVTVFAQGAAFAPGANNLGWLFANGLAAKIP